MSLPAKRPRSIAVPIFALTIVAVLVAACVFLAVIFLGPPPRAAPQSLRNIATILKTGHSRSRFGHPVTLVMSEVTPRPRDDELPDIHAATEIASLLGVAGSDVLVWRVRNTFAPPEVIFGGFTVAQRVGDRWRVMRTTPEPVVSYLQILVLAAMAGSLLVLAGPAWWIARAISRPLRELADSAATARAGAPLGPVPQGGASEVRDLAKAVSAMHDRLTRYAEGRTTMLAAIAHDLGTPLSRLAFWVEQLPEAARLRATADIDEMRAMIGATLRLARDEASERTDQRIDLGSLLDSLVEDMAIAGVPVTLITGDAAIVRGDPQALRRLFGNLLENAVRYGDAATVCWEVADGWAEIFVDDAGRGFDPAQVQRLFEPFVRGDPSRNRETGGTGLGLAIVRSIAEAHRGTVVLENHAGGGRVRVRLPARG